MTIDEFNGAQDFPPAKEQIAIRDGSFECRKAVGFPVLALSCVNDELAAIVCPVAPVSTSLPA
jgi:hypothetical protein